MSKQAAKKQSDRNAARKAKKAEANADSGDAGPVGEGEVSFALVTSLFKNSLIVQMAPQVKDLLVPPPEGAKEEKKAAAEEESKEAENKENEGGENEGEEKPEAADEEKKEEAPVGPEAMYESLKERLAPWNCLGLAAPFNGDDAKAAWMAFKELELDWGPRKARKGNPSLDRIIKNVTENFAQYLHALYALMLLRTVFYILLGHFSIFSFLLIFFGLQNAAVFVPRETIPPTVEAKFVAAGALAVHGFVWLTFAYHALWSTHFFLKFLIICLFAFHAHSVRPADP